MDALMDTIKVTAWAGAHVDTVISEAKVIAMQTCLKVEFEFNGVTVTVDRYDNEREVKLKFIAALGGANS